MMRWSDRLKAGRVDSGRGARGFPGNSVLLALAAVALLAGGAFLFAQHSNNSASNLAVGVAPAVELKNLTSSSVDLWIRTGTGGAGSLWGDSTSTCTTPIGTATTYTSGKYTNIPLSSIPFTSSNNFICAFDPGPASSSAFLAWPHTPTSLAFVQQPTDAQSGASISPAVTVKVLDANGTIITSSTDSVTLAIKSGTGTSGATLGGTVTQAAVNGIATFSNLSIGMGGTNYQLHATSGTLTAADSTAFNITGGSLDHFKVEKTGGGAIGTQTAGTAFSLRITAQDVNNNTVTSFTSTVSLSSTGTLTGNSVNTAPFTAGVLDPHSVTITNTGSFTITASGAGKTGTSTAFTVNPGAATLVRVETAATGSGTVVQTQNLASGNTLTVYAISRDASNNFVANVSATWSLASKTGGVVDGDLSPTTGTSATFTGHVIGTAAIHAVSGSLTSTDSGTITVTPGLANKLAFTTQPSGGTNGTAWAIQPAVTVEDANGNTVTGSSASITLAIGTNPGSGTLTCNGGLSKPASSGVATFLGCAINNSGNGYKLNATSTGLTSATSSTFNILLIGPSLTGLTVGAQSPNPVPAGSSATVPINSVTITAAGACTATLSVSGLPTGATGSFSVNPIYFTTQTTLTSPSALNVATLRTTPVGTTINVNVTATGSGGCGASSFALFNFVVSAEHAANAANSTVTASPTSVVADGSTTSTVTVTLKDGSNNLLSGKTVTLAKNGGSSTITTVNGTTNASGQATFTVNDTVAESTIYTATDTTDSNLVIAQTATVTFTASKVVFVQQPTNTVVRTTITPAVTVQLQDGANHNISTSGVSITLGLTTGTGTLSGAVTQTTNSSGLATFNGLSIDLLGSKNLTASSAGLTSAVSNAFNITAGAATKLVFTTQPTTTPAGSAITPPVTVQVQDAVGNLVTTDGSTVTITISSPGTFSGTSVTALAASGGVATFSNLVPSTVGPSFTLSATDGTLTSATSNGFAVNQASQTITVTTHAPASAVYGGNFTVAATASSGLTVAYSSAGGCTNSGATFTMTSGTAPCTVKYDQPGNSNFSPATQVTETVTAQKATLTVSGITASDKVYDGSNTATLSTGSAALVGVVSGDSANVTLNSASATGAFSSKTVGTSKTVTVSGLTISGTSAGNYTLTQPTTTANITAKTLTVTITANGRVYDGTTTATLNTAGAVLTGVVSGDTVTVNSSGYTATFADRNVAGGKSVTVSGLTLGGTDGANYSLTQPTGLTASITAKALTITGLTASAKVYDGTTAEPLGGAAALLSAEAAGAGTTSDGKPYSVDFVSAGGTASGTFADDNVGSAKSVTVTGVTITGTGNTNYTATQQTGLTADITKRAITVTAATNSKTYDGTTTAAAIPAITSGSLVSGDTPNFTEAYSTPGVGSNNKTLVPSGSVSDGNGGANYNVTFANFTTGTITARALTVTATNQTKTYGQTVTFGAGSTQFTSSGLQNGETIGTVTLAVSGSGGAATANVGSYTITPSSATGGTFTGSNYSITYNTGTLTVSQATTTTAVSSNHDPSVVGQSVTFTATVSPQYTQTPTGTVQFQIDGVNFGSPVTLSSGSANSGATTSMTVGNHVITAVYSGSTNFTTSTGTLSGGQDVGDFTLSQSATQITISHNNGTTNVDTISLTNLGGFTGSVALTCSDGDSGTLFSCNGLTGSGHIWFSPTSISNSATSTMNADPTTSTNRNGHLITITGTSGTLTRTLTFTLTVN